MYRFLKTVWHDPNGRTYNTGTDDELEDWNPQHIKSALTAGLIEQAPQRSAAQKKTASRVVKEEPDVEDSR